MSKHKLDLHDIFNKGDQIDRALDEGTIGAVLGAGKISCHEAALIESSLS